MGIRSGKKCPKGTAKIMEVLIMSKGMRKKIAVLLAAVMASAGLSACGGNTDAGSGGQDAESKTETKTDEAKTDSEKEGSGRRSQSVFLQECQALTAELS